MKKFVFKKKKTFKYVILVLKDYFYWGDLLCLYRNWRSKSKQTKQLFGRPKSV